MTCFRGMFSCVVMMAFAVIVGCGTKFTLAPDPGSEQDDASAVAIPDASGDDAAGGRTEGGTSSDDCQPSVKCGEMVECGSVSDGCDNLLQCGRCAAGSRCQLGRCVAQVFCGNAVCEPDEDCGSCAQDCKCAPGTCSAGKCCTPSCSGKQCGSDGCGGVCGDCPDLFLCTSGACVPMPSCGNGRCEALLMEDCASCARDCACPSGACRDGACCRPDCGGKTCGSDGCGGTCGPVCPDGSTCEEATGKCKEQVVCGNPTNPRLPGQCQTGENCQVCPLDCGCNEAAGEKCTAAGACCVPKCDGATCGPDSCGGQCGAGACPFQSVCQGGKCIGCGNGVCEAGETCANCADCKCDAATRQVCAEGACCTPECAGKTCGPNGCGGQCGVCAMGQACNPSGVCITASTCGDGRCAADEDCRSCPKDCACATPAVCSGTVCCTPQCIGACGSNGCGGSCGTCPAGTTCGRGGACVAVCGDGVCATAAGENCGTCASDCLCGKGATCFNNACCRVPTCGIDWECGPGTACGQSVDCGKCAYGTCVNHRCGTLCSTGSLACPLPVDSVEQ